MEETTNRVGNLRDFASYASGKLENLYQNALETVVHNKAIESFGFKAREVPQEAQAEAQEEVSGQDAVQEAVEDEQSPLEDEEGSKKNC